MSCSKVLFLIGLVFLSFAISCSSEYAILEKEEPEIASPVSRWKQKTKSSLIGLDSLSCIYIRQSDQDLLLLDLIAIMNDEYVLSISLEEADSLGIKSSLYQEYQRFVDRCNGQ